ncbi:MAG: hypothetical protein R3321_00270 [Nitrososphaeraceae archaeon]|nr:hypothetical protein [Nitrososphaeraceae archaeon]
MDQYKFIKGLQKTTNLVLLELFLSILIMAPFLIGILLLAQRLEGHGLWR